MRNNKELFKADIDSKIHSYPPFLLLGFVLFIGIVLFYYSIVATPISSVAIQWYVKIFLAVLVLEIILIKLFMPKEKVILVDDYDGLRLEVWKDKELIKSELVHQVKYWWNYNYGGNSNDDENPLGNNNALNGRGTANGLYLYVQINEQEEAAVYLKEKVGSWASTPHWDYTLEDWQNRRKTVIPCFYLKKLVKVLQERGY